MEKRKNIYATTNWEDATFLLRIKSLITMFGSFYFLGTIFFHYGDIFLLLEESM